MGNDFAYDIISPVRIVGKNIFSKTGRKVITGAEGAEDGTKADHKASGKKKVADKVSDGALEERGCVSLIFRSELKSVFRSKGQKIRIGHQFHCDQSDQDKS